jgi:hypothetical protein
LFEKVLVVEVECTLHCLERLLQPVLDAHQVRIGIILLHFVKESLLRLIVPAEK